MIHLVFAAWLAAAQLQTPDPCVQSGLAQQQTSDMVDGTLMLSFCWPDLNVPPTAVTFTIVIDGVSVYQGALTPKFKSASGPWYFEWVPAPPVVSRGVNHQFLVKVTDGSQTQQTELRAFLLRPLTLPTPFQPRAGSTP